MTKRNSVQIHSDLNYFRLTRFSHYWPYVVLKRQYLPTINNSSKLIKAIGLKFKTEQYWSVLIAKTSTDLEILLMLQNLNKGERKKWLGAERFFKIPNHQILAKLNLTDLEIVSISLKILETSLRLSGDKQAKMIYISVNIFKSGCPELESNESDI